MIFMDIEKKSDHYIPPSKEEFCRFCHLLYERHLVAGVGGNVSARSNDHIFLTPSGFSLRDVDTETVIVVNGKGFAEAINIAEEIDEAARIYLLTDGKAAAIPSDELSEIRQLR